MLRVMSALIVAGGYCWRANRQKGPTGVRATATESDGTVARGTWMTMASAKTRKRGHTLLYYTVGEPLLRGMSNNTNRESLVSPS